MAKRKTRFDAVIDAPFGRVGIILSDGALVDVSFLAAASPLVKPATVYARNVCRRLTGYFRRPQVRFDIGLALNGTAFQQRVWRALQRIPAGQVVSYGELARRLKSSPRAVGNACRRNPIPIIVPCHRVVAASGDGGFMGKRNGRPLVIKRWLLAHERGG
jgi:methylated-DNA-[protein]-cysteine S-methyltransferase